MGEKEKLIALMKDVVFPAFPGGGLDVKLKNQLPEHGFEAIADALIAGGVLATPCKVGDTVWNVSYGELHEATVVCIRPFVFKDFVEYRGNVVITMEDPFYSDGRLMQQRVFAVFGEDTFLAKGAAEAALEREKERGKKVQ